MTDPSARPAAALAALAGATLLAAMGSSIATVALPSLAIAFPAPVAQLQWVVLAYLLTMTVMIVSAGRLGDRHGHRRLLVIGVLVFTAASLAGALSQSLELLFAARAVQGVGAAVLTAMPMSIARNTAAPGRTGSVMGLLGTMSAIGTALGPSLGGMLMTVFGWQAAFGLLAAGGALVLAMVLYGVPKVSSAAIRVASPLASLGLLRSRAIATGLATNLLMGAIMMATLVVGALFLSFGLGLDATRTGLVMAVGPVTAALAGIPAGRLADRLGYRRATLIGLAETAFGAMCLAVLPIWWGPAGYVIALIVLTPGFQLFLASNNATVMQAAPDEQRGMTSGLLGLSRNLGLLAGASAMATLFAALIGTESIATASRAAIGSAFSAVFLVAAGLAIIAMGLVRIAARTEPPALTLLGRPRGSTGSS